LGCIGAGMKLASKEVDSAERRTHTTEARAVKKLADYLLQPILRSDKLDKLRRAFASAVKQSEAAQADLKGKAE